MSLKRRRQSQVSIAGTLNARAGGPILKSHFVKEVSERNQVAAYIASQIGQNAQSVQTTVAAFALLEAQPIPPKSPPPEGARVRMKKGLHLAMTAFYFGDARLGAAG
ncbi:hypothetical protein [Burkholderia pyrrocinia]|uniref:hypothetical protein n=1 Tax=Burkholderia pyrrocinia TaxID=60550 RepID=UPI0014053EEF|nr:hypothetical protein [Burkholderia pyrrocinia]